MLHALAEYVRREGLLAEPGFKPKLVRWLLMFDVAGRYIGLQDLAGEGRKSKGQSFDACPDLTQPEMIAAGCRHFLVDSLDVVVLLTKADPTQKDRDRHQSFTDLLRRGSRAVPILQAVADALDDDQLAKVRAQLDDLKAKPTDPATIAVDSLPLIKTDAWHDWWRKHRASLAAARSERKPAGKKAAAAEAPPKMLCLLTGDAVEPLSTHNKIEGLAGVGGLAMGDVLSGCDKDAFTSFGLDQGANAAMSERAVKTYATALNHLIKHPRRSVPLAGAKVVFWYSADLPPEFDPIPKLVGLFGDEAEADEPAEAAKPLTPAKQRVRIAQQEGNVQTLFDAIRTGDRPDLLNCRYFAATLSANAGRVVLRDWAEGSFEELVKAVDAWRGDLSIVRRDGKDIVTSHKFGAVLAAPVRELRDAPGSLSATLWRAAMKNLPIPYPIAAQTLRRVQLDVIQDNTASHARLGLLKAFYNRLKPRTQTMTAELNDHETDPAYVCGRIMALLARIQYKALGDVGASVVQRYYAAASATPALVLGRLIRTAKIAHLPKIEPDGLRQWFDNLLTDAWSRMQTPPPTALPLEGQTLFAMGYYHQLADLRKGKGPNSESVDRPAPA